MLPFITLFPELGAKETRSLQLLDEGASPPAGEFAFVELYCEEPDCDCRRALIQVRAKETPGVVLASISFGWESAQFYTEKLRGDADEGREAVGASLDPLLENSEHAPWFLRFFRDQLLLDPEYVARLQRHYRMFKDAVKRDPRWRARPESPGFAEPPREPAETMSRARTHPAPPVPFRSPPKVGRNDPCPCGSGRKYKKCCGQ